ncbi:MAG: hypothetical protein IPK75_12690 [Acidobacteria bacterium]|nr:hypothetical protein [Acidobacteriota bacterium]
MSDLLRPIAPIKAPDISPASLKVRPELTWLPLSALVINDEYQRSLSERSHRIIRRMVAGFDWGRVKALSVVETKGGAFEVIDGQHTAIAAATHGGIESLPCLITRGKTVAECAADFVSLNQDRLAMTPMQVFFAELAAGDEIAAEVQRGVQSAGGRILKGPPALGVYQPGDLICVGQLKMLAKRGGPVYVKRAVAIGVAAGLTPIKGGTLKAIEAIIWGNGIPVEDEAIIRVLRRHGQDTLTGTASVRAKAQGLPIHKVLAGVIRANMAEAA